MYFTGQPVVTSPNLIDTGFGNDVMIPCILELGNPTPTIQWSFNGSDTLPPNIYPINNDLYINDAEFNNDGMYRCTATNVAGSSSSTTVIIVHGMNL